MIKYISLLCIAVFVNLEAQLWNTYTTQNSKLICNNVTAVVVDSLNGKWFGTDSGLVHFNDIKWTNFKFTNLDHQFTGNCIRDLALSKSNVYGNELLIATDDGVSVINFVVDTISSAIPIRIENSEIMSNNINAIFVDKHQVKWFGSDISVSRLWKSEWIHFTTENGLSANHVLSIAGTDDGWRYIGTKGRGGDVNDITTGGGVSRLRDNGIDGITSASPYANMWTGLLSDSVNSILICSDGSQWFGTNKGASHHRSLTDSKRYWSVYRESDGLVNNFVQAIAIDSSGLVWLGTKEGVSSIDSMSNIKSYTNSNGLSGNNIRDIAVDHLGTIWFATNNGISSFKPIKTSIENDDKKYSSQKLFLLATNYPNPFNPSTTINYTLLNSGYVKLCIYNLEGQEIKSLVEGFRRKGDYSIVWNAKSFASGIYFYKLKVGKQSITKKLVLKK